MSGFLVGAGLCAALALLLILWPLWRARQLPSGRRWWTLLPALLGVAVAAALYWRFSNWPWAAPPIPSPALAATAELQQVVASEPANQTAWLRLGQNYQQLEQFELARRAFDRAARLDGPGRAAGLAGSAESIVLSGDKANASRAAALFEEALRLDPKSSKALFYTALAAMQSGQLALARERFATMLTLDAPTEIKAVLQRQIATIDTQLQPAALSPVDAATRIELDLRLAPKLQSSLPASASLFVFVRNPAGGVPLAVKRLPATFPQRVQLSAADSMIADSRITAGQKLLVVARVSAAGSTTAQQGDLSGQIKTSAGRSGVQTLLVDTLVQ
jgi:cytochrome c-type biogenesis protein CcmH